MKIDNAIKTFTEKYDRQAIESIDVISKDYGLNYNKATIQGFNINEAGNAFKEILLGYSQYKVENNNKEDTMSHEEIIEKVSTEIPILFETTELLYTDLPKFVSGYVVTIKNLLETVDQAKQIMLEGDVDNESIGSINTLTDIFIESLNGQLDPTMNRILWASGYNSKKALSPKTTFEKPLKPVFL